MTGAAFANAGQTNREASRVFFTIGNVNHWEPGRKAKNHREIDSTMRIGIQGDDQVRRLTGKKEID